jgi:Sulfatase
MLTGRNHHTAGMGGITEIATGAPGYSSVLPSTISPLARTLKLNGYSTAQFGKCHEVPVWETSPIGPFNTWPAGGGGFEYFYGFIGGEANFVSEDDALRQGRMQAEEGGVYLVRFGVNARGGQALGERILASAFQHNACCKIGSVVCCVACHSPSIGQPILTVRFDS